MPDVIDEILKFDPGDPTKKKKRIAAEDTRIDEILKFDPRPGGMKKPQSEDFPSPVGGTYVPTGEISTITSKPIMKYVPQTEEGAGFGTQVLSSFVDDPFIKAKIYSEARGMPITRYRVSKGGEVEFKTDAGTWQREVSQLPFSKAKRFAAEVVGHPSTYLSPVGAVVAGPIGAVGGAMGGELLKKGIGYAAYGETPGALNTLTDTAMQGIFALAGETVGKVLGRTVNRIMYGKRQAFQKAGRGVTKSILTPEEHARALWIKKLADQHKIQLAPHQIYDREGMTNTWKYLRKHPLTSDSVREFEERLAKSTDEAVDGFIREMGGYEAGPLQVGKQMKEAASHRIATEEELRRSISAPKYEAAAKAADEIVNKPSIAVKDLKTGRVIEDPMATMHLQVADKQGMNPARVGSDWEGGWTFRGKYYSGNESQDLVKELGKKVDVRSAIDEVDRLLGETVKGDPSHNALLRVKKMLDEAGGDFRRLDRVKRSGIDDVLGATKTSRTLSREMKLVKDKLTTAMDEQVPGYSEARAAYAELSKPIDRLKESIVGELAEMESEKGLELAPAKILSIRNVRDPERVKEVINEITRGNDPLRRRIIGSYIRNTYETLRMSEEGRVINVGGKMYKALFGRAQEREIMKAAMTAGEFKQFDNLMTVLQRTSIGVKSESMTDPLRQIGKELEGQLGSKSFRLMQHPKQSLVEWTFGKWDEIVRGRSYPELFDALKDPGAVAKMAKMRQLAPGSRRLIESMSVFTAEISAQMEKERKRE